MSTFKNIWISIGTFAFALILVFSVGMCFNGFRQATLRMFNAVPQSNLIDINNTNENLQKEIEQKSDQINDLTGIINDKDLEINKLKEDNSLLKLETSELNIELSTQKTMFEENINNLSMQINSLTNYISILEQDIGSLRTINEQNQILIDEYRMNIDENNSEIELLYMQINNLESQIQTYQEENIIKDERITNLENEKEMLINERNELINQVSTLENQLSILQTQMESLQSIIDTKQTMIDDYESQIQSLNETIDSLNRQVNELNERISQLEKDNGNQITATFRDGEFMFESIYDDNGSLLLASFHISENAERETCYFTESDLTFLAQNFNDTVYNPVQQVLGISDKSNISITHIQRYNLDFFGDIQDYSRNEWLGLSDTPNFVFNFNLNGQAYSSVEELYSNLRINQNYLTKTTIEYEVDESNKITVFNYTVSYNEVVEA